MVYRLRQDVCLWCGHESATLAVDSSEEEWTWMHYIKLKGYTFEYAGRGKSIKDVEIAQSRQPLDTTEIEILDPREHCYIAIGLARRSYPKHRQLGCNKGTKSYHEDDGKIIIGSSVEILFGPRYNKGDIMGCGILFPTVYDSEAECDLFSDDMDGPHGGREERITITGLTQMRKIKMQIMGKRNKEV
ncbi:hypothetical protein CHS0354_022311 [Potamilus streckersoni]|uniref:SPRY domain-containing protein n=1 Tax=Potamilus streckersoni TaxID=2493646 RepID=A0AAE0WE44_9BIVA|nr:hypothetical protein CHS0354_022311 [Potamilus streckersoni]